MLESKSSVLPFHHPAIIMAVCTGNAPVISGVTVQRINFSPNTPTSSSFLRAKHAVWFRDGLQIFCLMLEFQTGDREECNVFL